MVYNFFDCFDACEILENKTWTFAKTMAGVPHYYTVRDKWGDEREFEYLVKYIRAMGVQEKWGKYNNHYLYLSGYKYWTMGAEPSETLVINRARYSHETPYNRIAEKYDNFFFGKQYLRENKNLFQVLDLQGNILDIGCGTGLAVEWGNIAPRNYLGIDPSKAMLDKFIWKHPQYANYLRVCKFEEFWGRGFDTIIALYGTASYITGADRLLNMLNDGGNAYLMYYAPDYYPVTNRLSGIDDCKTVSSPTLDKTITFSNYIIEKWEN
jgi:hypothetical protein